jgi:hypothetical protein
VLRTGKPRLRIDTLDGAIAVQAVAIDRNRWSRPIRIGGRNQSDILGVSVSIRLRPPLVPGALNA